ncbi:DUF2007 domain-containing protein [Pseudoxanthomonas sp. z9]|uniref:putative signal transducing protein n=1 Tax=Pseudoxanthomonas sp. z9 TaxID=2584942 RepID=UPI001143AC93|nr:DUF2007 domain-containing protein [Pseudoxanthomonas sp. z9]MCL6712009.1 DUF2007 domain-containing protein [Pseudomonas sp. R2.Fl]
MRVVYLADNLFDAHMVKHALEDAGLPAFVFGESLMGGMGELPLFGVLRVCVPDPAWPEAQDVVARLPLAKPPEGDESAADSPEGSPLPA